MHVQAAVQMVEAVLLQVLVEERVAIHLAIDSVVSDYVWIQFQSTRSCRIVLGIGAIARPGIALRNIVHVDILMHHRTVWISSVRRVYYVTRQQCALVEIRPGAWHANCLFS